MLKALGGDEYVGLETFAVLEGLTKVCMISDEVTALCPITGQPDMYTVRIEYMPGLLGLESKSLKLYLQSFRDRGIFCEHLVVQIKHDVVEVLKPVDCKVIVMQKARGGITIVAEA